MAPAILRLEISRLTGLIQRAAIDVEYRNALVKTRYELTRFVTCLERAEQASVEAVCADHLRSALLALSVIPEGLDEETTKTISYVIDRIRYVHDRMGLVY